MTVFLIAVAFARLGSYSAIGERYQWCHAPLHVMLKCDSCRHRRWRCAEGTLGCALFSYSLVDGVGTMFQTLPMCGVCTGVWAIFIFIHGQRWCLSKWEIIALFFTKLISPGARGWPMLFLAIFYPLFSTKAFLITTRFALVFWRHFLSLNVVKYCLIRWKHFMLAWQKAP